MNWLLLKNSLAVSASATALAMSLGLVAALWAAGLGRRARSLFLAVTVIALALPPFLVTNCWLDLLGHQGAWRAWLPLDIYSLSGTVWILALLLWPITLLAVLSAWQRLEPSQLESEPALTGWALARWLLFPLARNEFAFAAVLTFVLALNDFAVPAILQTKVFTAEVWVSFNTTFDYLRALQLSWPLIVGPLLLLAWLRRRAVAWPRLEGAVAPALFRRQLGRGWFWCSGALAFGVIVLSVGLPLADLVWAKRTWTELPAALAVGWNAGLNSFSFAAVTALVCVGLGLLSWRWPVGALVWLPFLVPGVLLGIALIFAFNRPALGWVYQTAAIVVVAFVVRYLAIGWSGAAHAMRSMDRDLTDAARLDGAAGWPLFRHVHWPLIKPQLAAAWYLTYVLCLWDVETLVLIVPPGGETLALRVFNLLHYGHNAQVNALCLALLCLAIAPLALWWSAKCGMRNAEWRRFGRVGACLGLLVLAGCGERPSGQATLDSRLFSHVQVIGTRGTGPGQFSKPRSLAVDRHDNLYVADMTGRVQKFSPDGSFVLAWQMPQTDRGKPKGMCRDRAGNIVVIEPHYSRVNHFSPEGQLTQRWGQHGANVGQLALPRAAAVNSRGEIFVSEYGSTERVQQFTADGGKCLRSIGGAGTGLGEFNRPEGLGIDRQDRLYVADSCNHRIQVFSPEGNFLRAYGRAGAGRGELSYPYDVQVDQAGRQYVCEFGNSRVQVFDGNDQPLEILGGPGAQPGRLNNPWAIALDSKGNLYVADSLNHRVQKFLRSESVVSSQWSVVTASARLGDRLACAAKRVRTVRASMGAASLSCRSPSPRPSPAGRGSTDGNCSSLRATLDSPTSRLAKPGSACVGAASLSWRSPSPQPSPAARGRTVASADCDWSASGLSGADCSRARSGLSGAACSGSRSQRERAGVRENLPASRDSQFVIHRLLPATDH